MTVQPTTSDLLARGSALLAPVLEQPNLDAGILLAFSLGIARVRLKSHPEEPRTPEDLERYLALIERRAQGEPLAYITGMREFWTLELRVTRDVLVPRPETELLVERGAGAVRPQRAQVLDLGTGSGAIALALAAERPSWAVLATDASPAALAVARDNAQRLGLQRRLCTRRLVLPASQPADLTWWSAIRPMWMRTIRHWWPSRMSRGRR